MNEISTPTTQATHAAEVDVRELHRMLVDNGLDGISNEQGWTLMQSVAAHAMHDRIAALQEALRNEWIEDIGADDEGNTAFRCIGCDAIWVDLPEQHNAGCLAALAESVPRDSTDAAS